MNDSETQLDLLTFNIETGKSACMLINVIRLDGYPANKFVF